MTNLKVDKPAEHVPKLLLDLPRGHDKRASKDSDDES